MFADAYGEVWDSAGSFERKDIFQVFFVLFFFSCRQLTSPQGNFFSSTHENICFHQQDDSEFLFQFSSGIKVLFLFKKHM